jgi:hypothetical protein
MKASVALVAMLALCFVGAVPLAIAAPSAPPAAGQPAPKAKEPAPATRPAKKRPPSSSVGQGCLGCISPLDGLSSIMAVPPRGASKFKNFSPDAGTNAALAVRDEIRPQG